MSSRGGVWLGTVTRVTTAGVWVQVPRLGDEFEFGPCPALLGTAYARGQAVAVAFVEGRADDPIVLGQLG